MTDGIVCESMRNSISIARNHRALVGAYTTSFTVHIPALLRANRLYFLPAMQTSSRKPILNWYPERFPEPTRTIAAASVVVYRSIDVLRHATLCGVFVEQKATTGPPQSVFSLHRQHRKTHGSLV